MTVADSGLAADERPLDTTIEIVTPENIAFHFRLAGPFARFMAYAIDWIVRAAILLLLMLVAAPAGYVADTAWFAILLVAWFGLEWFYGGLFEAYMNGQTPGKRLLRLRVVTTTGQPIDGLQAVLRNLLRAADTMPWLMLPMVGEAAGGVAFPLATVGLACMVVTARFQRLGDLACGTMVISEEPTGIRGLVRVDSPRVQALAAQFPVDFVPTRTLVRAVSAYVERRRFFSSPRRRELSKRLARVIARRFRLPDDTDPDTLLCALYYRALFGSPQIPSAWSRASQVVAGQEHGVPAT